MEPGDTGVNDDGGRGQGVECRCKYQGYSLLPHMYLVPVVCGIAVSVMVHLFLLPSIEEVACFSRGGSAMA